MFLLRLTLPDQPGSLGQVATALGSIGADIAAIEVVERHDGDVAVDDFFVDLPTGGREDSLVSACQSVHGVRVLWFSRYPAGTDLHRDLEAVEAMTQNPPRAERLLVDLAPSVFHSDWALLVEPDEAGARIGYGTANAPDLPESEPDWLPLTRPQRLTLPASWDDHGWRDVAAAAAPLGSVRASRAVVVGRRGGPEILDSELARLAHLATLAETIRRAPPAPDRTSA